MHVQNIGIFNAPARFQLAIEDHDPHGVSGNQRRVIPADALSQPAWLPNILSNLSVCRDSLLHALLASIDTKQKALTNRLCKILRFYNHPEGHAPVLEGLHDVQAERPPAKVCITPEECSALSSNASHSVGHQKGLQQHMRFRAALGRKPILKLVWGIDIHLALELSQAALSAAPWSRVLDAESN